MLVPLISKLQKLSKMRLAEKVSTLVTADKFGIIRDPREVLLGHEVSPVNRAIRKATQYSCIRAPKPIIIGQIERRFNIGESNVLLVSNNLA